MKKGIISILVCMLMILSTIIPISGTVLLEKTSHPLAKGNTLYVGGSGPGNYTKIQDAINAAVDGDTVFVFNGIYHENVIINYKSINLIGENRDTTIIDGGGNGYVVRLLSGHINFTGFTVQDSGTGILILGDNVNVSGNIFLNNGSDIWLSHSNNTVSNNILLGGGLYISSNYGHQNIITNNFIKGRPLIYLEKKNNTIIDTDAGEIILIDCENITIQNQTLHGTSFGILLGRSRNCLISHNTISNCFIGIDFFQSKDNSIVSNIFTNNTAFGIHFASSTGNTISQNTISGSKQGSGIYIEYFSTFNTISHNTILSNGFGVCILSDHTIISDNLIEYNDDGVALFNNSGTYKNDSASFSIIQGNTISKCTMGGVSLSLINNCNVSDNSIYDNPFYGIEQLSCTDNALTKNKLVNNSWSGIHLGDSNNNLISGNAITSSNEGIYFSNSSRNSIIGNNLQINPNGIYLISSSNNSIENNNIIKNVKGVYLVTSNNNNINRNNFKRNTQHAFFLDCNNSWDANYWNRLRFLPYPIFGKKTVTLPFLKEIQLPSINFDRHPALKPYDIPRMS